MCSVQRTGWRVSYMTGCAFLKSLCFVSTSTAWAWQHGSTAWPLRSPAGLRPGMQPRVRYCNATPPRCIRHSCTNLHGQNGTLGTVHRTSLRAVLRPGMRSCAAAATVPARCAIRWCTPCLDRTFGTARCRAAWHVNCALHPRTVWCFSPAFFAKSRWRQLCIKDARRPPWATRARSAANNAPVLAWMQRS